MDENKKNTHNGNIFFCSNSYKQVQPGARSSFFNCRLINAQPIAYPTKQQTDFHFVDLLQGIGAESAGTSPGKPI